MNEGVRANKIRSQTAVHMGLNESHALLGTLLIFEFDEHVVVLISLALNFVAKLGSNIANEASVS